MPLWIRPQSFFQIRRWGALRDADDAPDRYRDCPEAIACARQSAAQLGLSNLHFQALDSTQFATHEADARSWCWLTAAPRYWR